jgi:hypothetical protein
MMRPRRAARRYFSSATRSGSSGAAEGRGFMRREFNVLALIKDEERYVYVYDDESRGVLLEFLQDQAADSTLALNWFDAAVLAKKAHEQAATAPGSGQ